jgi:D-glycero-alpha-D-manno-heptose 1-phosphate guanylyltransferase
MNGISAAILAGGLGTRLRSVVADQPKVLAPVGGRPYLTYLLDRLADAGFKEVVLLTGFRAEMVWDALGDNYAGMRLVHSREPQPLGTAGALRRALPYLTASTVLVLNGDSFCNANLYRFCHSHCQRCADVSLVASRATDTARFGRVRLEPEGRVSGFEEKDAGGGPGWINAGIYLLRRALIEEIEPGKAASLARDLFPAWVRHKRFCAYRTRFGCLDIGTPQSYAEAVARAKP